MSSVSSRRTPEPLEHRQALHDALVEVAENSFFAFVEPLDRDAAAEALAAVPAWLEAEVRFTGAFGGRMRLAVAEPLALELFASFLGLDPGEAPDDARLFDLVGELGNMVCGAWLTRSCLRRRFDLQHPAVARRPLVDAPEPHDLQVTLNGQPAIARLRFVGA